MPLDPCWGFCCGASRTRVGAQAVAAGDPGRGPGPRTPAGARALAAEAPDPCRGTGSYCRVPGTPAGAWAVVAGALGPGPGLLLPGLGLLLPWPRILCPVSDDQLGTSSSWFNFTFELHTYLENYMNVRYEHFST